MPPWLIEFATCPSTNTWLRERAAGLPAGTVAWTRRQTAGRGRPGHRWWSPAGVLTCSVLLRPVPLTERGRLALAAGLAVCHAVEDRAPQLAPSISWPNDILLGEAKLAGLLSEATADGLVIGIGLNLDPDWGELEPAALATAKRPVTSLAAHGVEHATMPELISDIRGYLLQAQAMIAAGHWAGLHRTLARRDALRGRQVTVVDGRERYQGLALGIDEAGQLLVDTRDGHRALHSGSVVTATTPTPEAAPTGS